MSITVNLGCNHAYIISVLDPGGFQGLHGLPFLASAMIESYVSKPGLEKNPTITTRKKAAMYGPCLPMD